MSLTQSRGPRVVVDNQNTPLAILDYENVLRQGLLHRQVILVLTDQAERILLHKRPAHAALYPGRWDCMGSTDIPLHCGAEDMAWALMPAGVQHEHICLRHVTSLPASADTGNAFVELFCGHVPAWLTQELLRDLSFLAADHDEMQALVTSFPDQLTPTLFLTWNVLCALRKTNAD